MEDHFRNPFWNPQVWLQGGNREDEGFLKGRACQGRFVLSGDGQHLMELKDLFNIRFRWWKTMLNMEWIHWI